MVKNWFLHRPNQVVKKWSNGGFGPSQMMTPKSGEKVVKKWSQPGPGPAGGHKNGKKMMKKWCFGGPGARAGAGRWPGLGPAPARPARPQKAENLNRK